MRRGWAVLFGLLLLIAVAHIAWTASVQSEFEARLDAIRAAGEPIDPSELNHDPVPPSLDAAPLLRRVAARLEGDPNPAESSWFELIDGEPVEESELAACREWLARTEPLFAWIEEAAAKPAWDPGVDWRDGVNASIDWIPSIQAAMNYLRWRAYFAESPEQATECATVLFDLARKTNRASGISCLVRWVGEGLACEILERCARKFGTVAPLGDRLAVAEDPDAVRDALLGERAVCVTLILEWARGETNPILVLQGVSGGFDEQGSAVLDFLATSPFCRPLAYGDGVRALAMFDDALQLHELSPWEALEQAEGLDERHNHGIPWIFSTLWRVLPARLAAERCRHLATLRVTDAGLAVLAWRNERGDWPATLADVGEWIDPFTGDPLQYTIEEDGSVRIEAQWWLPFADDEEKIEFDRSIGQDIAWILEAR